MNIECIKFIPYAKGFLQGFADFYISDFGIEIQDCSVYYKDGKRWVNLPARQYEKEGEKRFAPYVRFRKKEDWDSFIEASKAAIDTFCAESIRAGTSRADSNSVFSKNSSEFSEEIPF